MLVERLNRLIHDMKKQNFIKKDTSVHLFEHETKPHKMAVLHLENDLNDVIICYSIDENDDIRITVEDTPVVDGTKIESHSSESDFYIEDDELTDMTINILTQYGVANGK